MRGQAVALVALLCLSSAVAVAPAAGTSAVDTELLQPDGFDRTVFDVTVHDNGSAEWAFEHRRLLEDESEEVDFQSYADAFESSETPLYRDFVNQSEALATVGSRQTDREMVASNHSRSASIDSLGQTEGVVRMSFQWSNFGEATADRVLVADVFEGGLVLGEDQRIVFEGGDDVEFDAVQPQEYTPSGANLSSSDSVTFFGPREFADRRPHVEYLRTGATGGPVDAGSQTNLVVFVALLLVVLGAVAALAWRFGLVSWPDSDATQAADAAGATSEPTEIKSDSDRVLELLEDNGSRMKQVDIVEETDWSKSKVSMLLSDMEEEGEITKLRVGRENIVSLAGHEPEAAGSPFEEQE